MKTPRLLSCAVLLIGSAVYPGSTALCSKEPRIINTHGRQVASIFEGSSPNSKLANELFRFKEATEVNRGSCSVLKAVYHTSDRTARFMTVQGGCRSHYQEDTYRDCDSDCDGGSESWTFSYEFGVYCQGYMFDFQGCSGRCTEELTCYSDFC